MGDPAPAFSMPSPTLQTVPTAQSGSGRFLRSAAAKPVESAPGHSMAASAPLPPDLHQHLLLAARKPAFLT